MQSKTTVSSVDDGGAINKSSSDHNAANNYNVATMKHHEGKNMDVTDINVNVNVVASSNHANISTSCCPSSMSSSDSSTNSSTNNIQSSSKTIATNNKNNSHNNNINVISVCDNSGNISNGNGIIITETHHDCASYYDAIKLEENGTTAIIYETIVIENPSTQQSHDIVGFMSSSNNNHKFITNTKTNHITLEANTASVGVGGNSSVPSVATTATPSNHSNNGGGIIVLTGSLNELLLSQNTQQICQPQNSGTNIKCLSDVKNQIQSIVLNLNSQSSASTTGSSSITTGQVGNQPSIMLAINQQVRIVHFKLIKSVANQFFPLRRMNTLCIQRCHRVIK